MPKTLYFGWGQRHPPYDFCASVTTGQRATSPKLHCRIPKQQLLHKTGRCRQKTDSIGPGPTINTRERMNQQLEKINSLNPSALITFPDIYLLMTTSRLVCLNSMLSVQEAINCIKPYPRRASICELKSWLHTYMSYDNSKSTTIYL